MASTLVDEEIVGVVHDQAGEVQFAGDNGVVDSLQDEADDNTPFPAAESKIRPILGEVLTMQSSLSAKACAETVMLCLRKQGQPSPGFVWDWCAGRRSGRQPRADLPCCKADSQILWSCRFKKSAFLSKSTGLFQSQTPTASRHYHELKQFKSFLIVWISVRKIERSIFVRFQTTFVAALMPTPSHPHN